MANAKRSDLDFLQGSWNIESLETDAQKLPDTMLAGGRIPIQGDRFASTGMGSEYDGTLELDTSAKPARITMRFASGPEKGNTNLGIYDFGKAAK